MSKSSKYSHLTLLEINKTKKICKANKSLTELSRNFFFLLAGIGFLSTSLATFGPQTQNSVVDFANSNLEKTLAIVQENSLLPNLNPLNPEPQTVRKIKVVITAYSSTISQTDNTPFITAAGTTVREGIVANNLLSFGTKIKIPELYGDKIFVVEDRMNSKKGYYHVDIWFPSYQEAKNFGAKRTHIEVLES